MADHTSPFLAIVLNPKRVTLAEAHFVDETLRVTTLGDIEPPAAVFDGNQIADGEALGRAVGEFVSKKQIAARDAVMVLPDTSAITQLIKLPSMPHDDMLGAVRSVAERYAIFAEHAVNVDCAMVEDFEEDGNPMSNVLLTAARAANVEQCQECARTAGLELIAVEVAPVAAANAYRDRLANREVVALTVVGDVRTDIMIFDRGMLRLCYSANVGLPLQTDQGDWMTPPSEEGDPFTAPPQLYSEITHCFRFFQNQFPRSAVERVILAADHPQGDMVVSHLAEQLQVPVELGRPDQTLTLPAGVDAEAAATSRALALALIQGTAKTALRESQVLFPLNLIPPSSTMWRPARPYIKLGVAAVAVILAAGLLWAWSLGNKIREREVRLAAAKAEIERLQPDLDALRAAQATELALYSEIERQTARIARERAVRWSQILVDISDRLPRDMWLTRLSSPDSSKMMLSGLATNRETIPNAIQSLGGSPYLQNVRLSSLTKDDTYSPGGVVIRYQVNGNLLRGIQPPLTGITSTSAASGQEEVAR